LFLTPCRYYVQVGFVLKHCTGNPYVRFDEGMEVERPPPTLQAGAYSIAGVVIAIIYGKL